MNTRSDQSRAVTEIRLFHCGECENDMRHIIKGAKAEKRRFPAAVALIRRGSELILLDTGYSRRIFNCGFKGRVYNRLNPTFCAPEDELVYRLRDIGVKPDDIGTIILSHLHPDHIAGLRDFPKARLILSEQTLDAYRRGRIRDLIFTRLLPEDFGKRIVCAQTLTRREGDGYFPEYFDLFDSGELLLCVAGGHAKGQMGLYMPEQKLFFAADMCWSLDLLPLIPQMKRVSRAVQYNYAEYLDKAKILTKMLSDGIRVIPCHGKTEEGILYSDEQA